MRRSLNRRRAIVLRCRRDGGGEHVSDSRGAGLSVKSLTLPLCIF